MLARAMASSNDNFYHATIFSTEADTIAFAGRIARLLRQGDTITLAGGLGVGKTVFARALVRAFLPREEVPSPTFTLVQSYETTAFAMAHVDLYRVKERSEFRELGLDEALDGGVLVIEWPDRMGELLPYDRLDIILSPGEAEGARAAQIIARGSWAARIRAMFERDTRA